MIVPIPNIPITAFNVSPPAMVFERLAACETANILNVALASSKPIASNPNMVAMRIAIGALLRKCCQKL